MVRAIRAALKHEGVQGYEVSVLLTDDAAMRELNCRYRQQDASTDVLSFAQLDAHALRQPDQLRSLAGRTLGDIVISVDTANRQARERGVGLGSELAHLAAHGALHLLGYDDETEAGYAEMVEREAAILGAAFGEARP